MLVYETPDQAEALVKLMGSLMKLTKLQEEGAPHALSGIETQGTTPDKSFESAKTAVTQKKRQFAQISSGSSSSMIGLGGAKKNALGNKLFKTNTGGPLLTLKQQTREKDLMQLPKEELKALLESTQSQIATLTTNYEVKVQEKIALVFKHKAYYGSKC